MRQSFILILQKKMKTFNLLTLIGIFLIMPFLSNGQSIDKENTYTLTGKAKRGTLANVEELSNGDYKLYYVTKATAKKAKFEIYIFDHDFNFKGIEEDIIEFEKIKTKYSWFDYNGELYSVDAITLNWNPAMPLKLKKKRITYKYDWLFLGYYKTVEILDKVKPRTEDGKKYFAMKYFEDEITGDIYIVAGVRSKLTSKDLDVNEQFTNLHVLKFDWDLNLVGDIPLEFEFPQEVAFGATIPSISQDNDAAIGVNGACMVFAPVKIPGKQYKKDPNKSNFTFVQFDSKMKLNIRESFESPSPGWSMEDLIFEPTTDGMNYYVYGPAAFGKDKYHQIAATAAKKKSIQLMKVENGKVKYVTENTLEDITAKSTFPPSQSKGAEYKGKKFQKAGYASFSNGDLLVSGQNFQPNSEKGNQYKDVLAFHFDNNGMLKAQYSVDVKPAGISFPSPQTFTENNNGVFWSITEASSTGNYYASIGKININTNKVGDFMTFGKVGKKQTYFINKKFPMLANGTDQVVYFGGNKSGKNIWFCRVNLK